MRGAEPPEWAAADWKSARFCFFSAHSPGLAAAARFGRVPGMCVNAPGSAEGGERGGVSAVFRKKTRAEARDRIVGGWETQLHDQSSAT